MWYRDTKQRPLVLNRHALYLLLSLVFASRFFSLTAPTSHAITDGDPALNAWALQWMSHALVHDPLRWYAGNTFYPYERSGISFRARSGRASYDFPMTSSWC